ncbi:MAG TPA: VOC family protein [Polyangiaceae bacterium]|nr:VOC family protein [Polyangiaceae bacterium]
MPALRYRDADTAIRFLVQGLGFKQHARYDGPNGVVAHAELTRGTGMVLLGTDAGDGKALDGVELERGPAATYLVVEADAEVDALYASAMQAGATSVSAPKNQDYGGRGATVRDPAGNYWSIGSYKPSSAK